MSIIEAQGLKKDWTGEPVLEDLSFSVNPGDRIGLIGRNGGGKTTLLRIIAGLDDDFSGSLRRAPEKRVGYVPQYLPTETDQRVGEFLLGRVAEQRLRLAKLEAAMGETAGKDLDKILSAYQDLQESYDAAGGDTAEGRMERFLQGAGLGGTENLPLKNLSGGERNILSLLKEMIVQPDLLLLDEPGNHLDYAGLAWLEAFLREQKCSYLVVSHNRYLLDRVTEKIWELEERTLTQTVGNYSTFRLEKLKAQGAGGKQYKADQKKIQRLEELVRRFEEAARNTADPAWGRRLRARRTQLEKARELAAEKPVLEAGAMDLNFTNPVSRADIAVSVTGYSKGFGERVLFEKADLFIATGERVALVGPNGCGKSTFLKDLVSRGNWNNPVLRIGPSMVVGYCDQHQEVFSPEESILETFRKLAPGTADDIFRFLSRFLFIREDMQRPLGTLSGGERNRLQLARAIYLKANLLILDEPTNHLDIPSREAMENGLEDFQGTLLVVSHDRYFLDKIAERVVEVEGQGFTDYQGNFSEFWAARRALNRSAAGDLRRRSKEVKKKKPEPGDRGKKNDLEDRIMRLEAEQRSLEGRIDKAYKDCDYRKGSALSGDLERLVGRIEKAYEEWGE
ncbi:MAG: ABC-F family ATP-binding cassette domain-containing protein [Spirochaetales bacterium]|nr:ABC-F family ATP-binding cassette domain-containing protein [Spirochaetales bacterium]